MAAVLQAVVDDCRGPAYRGTRGYRTAVTRRDARRAIDYVASTDRKWPFSFENVCEALGLDAGRLRRELRTVPIFASSAFVIPPSDPDQRLE